MNKHMRMKNLMVLLFAAGVVACQEPMGPGTLPQVLVEIEYINHAFGNQYFGFFVNGLGDLYRYDRLGAEWEFQDSTSIQREPADNKYAPIKNILEVRPFAEMRAIEAKLEALPAGPLSVEKRECADAGTLTYWAYKYDVEGGRYTRILLRREGDVAQQNTSAVAQDLIAYIRSLNLMPELLGCDP